MKFGKKKDKENIETKEKDNNNKEKKENEKKDKKDKKSNNSKRKNDEIDNNNSNNNVNIKKVFGGYLPVLLEEDLPSILVQTIDYLESYGLETAGIFRENGSLASIQNYRALYDSGKPVNFPPHEAHVVASLLKAYLRELKEPLCTFEHYDMFVACESIADEKVKVELLKKVISHLPPYNRKVMKYIFSFLQKVVENSVVNKMAPDALSVVFLPTILRPKANTDLEILQFTVEDSKSTKTLMSSIILNYQEIFEDESLFQPRTRQARAHTEFVSPPSSQNSTSSILSNKNPISPRSPLLHSPNLNNNNNTLLQPPQLTPLPLSFSVDDNNSEPSSPKPNNLSNIAPAAISNLHTINVPPPLPDKKSCKLLPNLSSNESITAIAPPQPSPEQQASSSSSSSSIPLLEIPTTASNSENVNSSPLTPTKANQLPTLPNKPPSLTLPPKPIPKIPIMVEYENNVRQRSNTTMV